MLWIALASTTAAAVAEVPGPFQLDVPARGFEEHCLKLEAGDRIRYRYTASAAVDFNIHYHRGKDVLYPVEVSASRAADARFAAPHADTYCLMWERKSEGAVRIDGAVQRVKE